MRIFLRCTAFIIGALALVIAALVAAWELSPDFRYRAIYVLMEHFDLNPPITTAALRRQSQALKAAVLIDANGKAFDWNAKPKAVIWINEWANWCVPCRMEFGAMQALQNRVGRDKLRIVLLSQPRYWEADKRLAKTLGLGFELITPMRTSPSALAAINLASKPDGAVFPETTFFRADGSGIEAFQSVKDWNSAAWEAIVLHWYNEGLTNKPHAG
jgi:thiol-disulfide isomerase/thioredoxin